MVDFLVFVGSDWIDMMLCFHKAKQILEIPPFSSSWISLLMRLSGKCLTSVIFSDSFAFSELPNRITLFFSGNLVEKISDFTDSSSHSGYHIL